MHNDRIDKWANELEILGPHVVMAGRKLAKVRYRDLEKTDWHGEVTKFKPTTSTGILIPPVEVYFYFYRKTQIQSHDISCSRFRDAFRS